MYVFVTLPDDLEQFVFAHAQAVGVPVETLLAQTIVERWDSLRPSPTLPAKPNSRRACKPSFRPNKPACINPLSGKATPEHSPTPTANACCL